VATFVVVLAGGAGTRFWPSGRRARPKQLLPITGGRSMLAETMARCAPLAPPERRYVVTNEVQADATRRECPELPAEQVVAEPAMRNTAAAIGLAAVHIERRDPDAIMIVLPADHHIAPQDKFLSCFLAAVARAAEAPSLLTIGIQPTGPATGYGYIEAGAPVTTSGGHPVLRVESFVEKPDAGRAQRFVESGRYFWNAGTFVWRVRTLLEAFDALLPGHAAVLRDIRARLDRGEGLDAKDYERFESVPIDKGIMEKASNVEVIPSTFSWDDVGSWLAVDRLHPRDAQGNVVRGDHVGIDTRNCIVVGRGHLVATVGVEDLIIVHTPDATLVCSKDRAEDVKKIVERLQAKGRTELL
jgi:mannose-1-phosphate guanylyltransferase